LQPKISSQVESFWKKHLPVLISVADGYSYAALEFEGRHCSGIVTGREPEYEEASLIFSSYSELLTSLFV